MDQFDLTFRPIFDAEGGRLIRPPSLGFWFGCIQKKLNSSRSLSKSLPFPVPGTRWLGPALRWTGCKPPFLPVLFAPLPPPSLSLNFDGESTLRFFAPVAAAVPGRRSSRWPYAPTRRGARMAPGALLDWLAATPLPPRPPRSPPPSPDLDRASDLRGPSCPAAMRTLAAPPPC